MPTIRLRFPGGRYHATPWGHHVNEGQIEWPPCPWRLLRALIAVGYSTQRWNEVPPAGRRMIELLASVLPTYQLPQAGAAHSRHYMPIGEFKKPPVANRTAFCFSATATQRADLHNYFTEDTALVFDTWANVEDQEMAIRWDCELDPEANALFRSLVDSLGYLGRSESWVEAGVAADDLPFSTTRIAVPCVDGEYRGAEWEQVSLLAPVRPDVYAEWRKSKSEAALLPFPLLEGKRKPTKALEKKRESAVAPFPKDLLDCLQKDTAWWKGRHHWSQPPGSRRVLYWRRSDSFVVSHPRALRRPRARPVEAILLALTTPSRNKSALPHIQRTLPQAELFHRAIVERVGKGRRVDCPELTGRDEGGKPLRQGHQHAHVLPVDLDGDQHLDHVLVYTPMCLGDAAQNAIRSLKRTWTKGGVGELQVAVVGRGDLASLRRLTEPLDQRIEQLLGPPQGSCTWISVTPFVPPRFLKPRGPNTLPGQINAELASRNQPPAQEVEVLPWTGERLAMRHFVRCRRRGGAPPPVDIGFCVRFRLTEPVTGPLALGYASHFGLGMFAAVPEGNA